ncbi:MAG: molybdopterin guanine dinucleotide-containing S/N-oxide reductase [Rhodospirillaceae bacterium]|nr:molybdopterin guanine dinucleotide-containing S/N-oxide reductase [Rhodospirillaceae bacterium]
MPKANMTDAVFAPTVTHWGAYRAEVREGRVAALHPFAADPDPSPIGAGMPPALTDPVRIARPMIRQGWLKHGPHEANKTRGGEPFVAVPWDEALDLVAGELQRVKAAHGNAAIFAGSYGWASAGRFHHAQGQLRRFMNLFGGHAYSVNTYSAGAAEVIVPHVLGNFWELTNQMTTWDTIAAHTQLMVAFGGVSLKNGQVHGGGFGKHVAREALKACKARGVKVVCVGAMKDDAADFLEAQWIAPRPNTDTALMLGLAHTLLRDGLADEAFLASHCVGWEKFKPYLLGAIDKTPKDVDWASRITGVPPEIIHQLAHDMARHRTLITISWSLQRADHGEQTYWAAITLAAMLGQIGLPGGGIGFGYGAANGIGAGGARIAPPSLTVPQNPVKAFIPVARIADMLENPGGAFDYNGQRLAYPDARIVYWCGGNPFHHHQNLGRLVRAWQRPETVIIHEAWWNANARHADIVLPVTTTLERNDLTGALQDTYALAMHKAVEPIGEARNDHDIFAGLAERVGLREAFTEGRDEMGWLKLMYERWVERAAKLDVTMPAFDAFWEKGHVEFPERGAGKVFLREFRADPAQHKLTTPSGKIEIFSERIASFGYDDCAGHATWYEPAEWLGAVRAKSFPLHLISNQPRTRLHSQYDNGTTSQAGKVSAREPVWLHPLDAAPRAIASGDVVRLFNDRGACLAGAVVTDQVRPGVVQLATGAWFDPAPTSTTAGGNELPFCVHGNPNVLTRDASSSKLAQGSTAQTCLVEVEKWTGTVPPVTIFTPPEIVAWR